MRCNFLELKMLELRETWLLGYEGRAEGKSGRALHGGEVNKANADAGARATAGHFVAWSALIPDNTTTQQPSTAAEQQQ